MVKFRNRSQDFFGNASPSLRERATPVVDALSPGFDVTWFSEESDRIWQAVLKPCPWVRERFGLLYEYLLVANHHNDDFHVRTLTELQDDRLSHRIDRQLRFIASDAPGVKDICSTWARDQGVSVIVLTPGSLDIDFLDGREHLDAILSETLWVRDRFNVREPVRTPGEFFGREALVNDCVGRLRRGENLGIMGLRKIGKTSVLRRIEDRLRGAEGILAISAFVSCNGSDVKSSPWSFLADRLIADWSTSILRQARQRGRRIGLDKVKSLSHVTKSRAKLADAGAVARAFSEDFRHLLKAAGALAEADESIRLVAFLDEADHLNPEAADADHWKVGYFHFWNTIQSLKRSLDESRMLTWVVGGVNPHILEAGSLMEYPNPLFETPVEYLKTMTREEAGELLNGLGKPMGLAFESEAIDAAFSFTAGHPTLLRQVGSLVHKRFTPRTTLAAVTARMAVRILSKNKRTFLSHISWILSHLSRIATDEYLLLRDLCVQGPSAFTHGWEDREYRDIYAQHLEDFGLLKFEDDSDVPEVTIPLIRESFVNQAKGNFNSQKRQLRDAVDGVETAIRYRLINDLQYPADAGWSEDRDLDEEPPTNVWHSTSEVVDLVVGQIPRKPNYRPKTREELRSVGESDGLEALFQALNWEDYVLLIEKNFDSLRLSGAITGVEEFIQELREAVNFFHVIRHNNEAELRAAIRDEGLEGVVGRVTQTQAYFAD